MSRFEGKRFVVVGASEGVGREIVMAARREGARVMAVARRLGPLEALAREFPGTLTASVDATTQGAPERVFAVLEPDVLVVCGGAHPVMGPFHEQTWEQFSAAWDADVKASFAFCGAALARPLAPGSVVVLISSGAGLAGSHLSGGYAAAKRMQMFLAEYAQEESDRLGLGLRFIALVPRRIMPETALGKLAASGYSSHFGISVSEFLEKSTDRQTPMQVADALLALVADGASRDACVFTVSATGTEAVP